MTIILCFIESTTSVTLLYIMIPVQATSYYTFPLILITDSHSYFTFFILSSSLILMTDKRMIRDWDQSWRIGQQITHELACRAICPSITQVPWSVHLNYTYKARFIVMSYHAYTSSCLSKKYPLHTKVCILLSASTSC